jgi:hypothetical protein
VYFNATGKVMELHLAEWMRETDRRWPSDPLDFLEQDDTTAWTDLRASDNRHARALVDRDQFPIAFETREHMTAEEKAEFEKLLPELEARFAGVPLLYSNASKDPHRLGRSRVLTRLAGGELEPLATTSQFMRHLSRIERYRVYSPRERRADVGDFLRQRWSR